ncbi:MAG: prenyltransferase [Kiritimatiellaeota bacterium]|nr:prenyltransferase [Kiritimatiellota bacterium]
MTPTYASVAQTCRRPRPFRLSRGLPVGLLIVGLLEIAPNTRADRPAAGLSRFEAPVDAAVNQALEYLASQQLEDGSFPAHMSRNTAIASLCVMAFLARGDTPESRRFGPTVNRGIDFVLRSADDKGLLVGTERSSGPMYSHTISTLMLCEVSGMVSPERQARIDAVLPRALAIIIEAQKRPKSARFRGGWRYQPTSSDSDISCTGWALMALRSARNSGAAVPRSAVDAAIAFVMRCRNSDGGFGYQPGGGSGPARTGTALLCLELSGQHGSEPCRKAGDWILKNLPLNENDQFYYYGLYYTAQGMFQLGGAWWEQFATWMFDSALKRQKPDGSWPAGHSNEEKAGPCYSTAMTVLALSVVYRQLPIYQR